MHDMSYRGLKRVLGETNLERKCRYLFLACLALLIAGAFWWVSTVTENLVKDVARTTGRQLVATHVFEYHLDLFFEKGRADPHPSLADMFSTMGDDLQLRDYEADFLSLQETGTADVSLPEDKKGTRPVSSWIIRSASGEDVSLPKDTSVKDILPLLKEELKIQGAEESRKTDGEKKTGGASGSTAESVEPSEMPQEIKPVFAERRVAGSDDPDKGRYEYYQPVYWKRVCSMCPHGTQSTGAFSAADEAAFLDDDAMFRVVKVAISDDEMQGAIERTRAILIAAGIVTVFLSMIALYIIVRYVVVKPLKHLRDVSDEISRGNTELRAEIQTHDEFEDLAASFNRMLRHLTEAQEELRKVNFNLDAKVDQLAQANMQLFEMNRLKSDFLASMSHELRTPLNSIIGFSDVLRGIDALDDKQQRYVRNIQQSGRVLLDMINDILDLAKMESGKMALRPSDFHIGAVVAAQCDMVRSLTEEKNIDLECKIQPQLPPMHQDQGKVQQILTNLLSNAIKFTPEGGRIVVSASRDRYDHVCLTVTDTGVGIAEEDREIIFEKFRQGTVSAGDDHLTREFTGTGLGLSIVKELCILLGGEVTLTSELGKGSSFAVRLPWTRPDLPEGESDFAEKLDDLTRPYQGGFAQAAESPTPVTDAPPATTPATERL